MNKPSRFAPDRRSGQAVVEFALIVPLLFLIMVIIIDFGRALYIQVALQNGAREGARYGTVHPTLVTSFDKVNPDNIVYRASTEPAATVPTSNVTVTCTTPAGISTTALMTGKQVADSAFVLCAKSGSRLEVRVTAQFAPLTPVISNIVGSSLTLTGDAVMTIE